MTNNAPNRLHIISDNFSSLDVSDICGFFIARHLCDVSFQAPFYGEIFVHLNKELIINTIFCSFSIIMKTCIGTSHINN